MIETPFLFDVKFKNAQEGLVAGLGGVILRTEDGGRTWHYAETNSRRAFFSVGFGGGHLVAVGERGQQRISGDGGSTWTAAEEGFPEQHSYMRDLVFGNPQRGWIIGADGLVLRTDDGGLSWTKVLPPERKWADKSVKGE